ncbi:hypothetical protein [Diplocloster hominis]|uniref:hypothetical protein n=1 Tax=Diplocloster hominis TaxID=3079010 RepID=UPI0031BB1144
MTGIDFIYDVNKYFEIPKKHAIKLMTRKLRYQFISVSILLVVLSIFLCFKWYLAKGIIAAIYFYLIIFLIAYAIDVFSFVTTNLKLWSETLSRMGFLQGEKVSVIVYSDKLCLQSEHATFLMSNSSCYAFISSNSLYINWGRVRQNLLIIPINASDSKTETLKDIEQIFEENNHLTHLRRG